MKFPKPAFALAAPLLCAAALAACEPAPEAALRSFAPGAAVAPLAGEPLRGTFRVSYGEVRDTVYAQWQKDFREMGLLEEVAGWLNGWVALPEDITLAFGECGEPNAFYHAEDRSVVVCYELVEEMDGTFAAEPDGERAVNDAVVFTALHEVGHALVDLLELPVTGREEDAVDQLAALVLAEGVEGGDEAALNGIRGLAEEAEDVDATALADEHALGPQRIYNVVCLVYGRDPEAYADWVDDILPAERAEQCPEEYERLSSSWDRLLAPYLKS